MKARCVLIWLSVSCVRNCLVQHFCWNFSFFGVGFTFIPASPLLLYTVTLHWLHYAPPLTIRVAAVVPTKSHNLIHHRHQSNKQSHNSIHFCTYRVTARSRLRSADHGDSVVPRARSTRFGCRMSFRVCGPTIWNKLPQNQRSTDTRKQYKRRLKGWLFESAYSRHWLKVRLTNGFTYLLT